MPKDEETMVTGQEAEELLTADEAVDHLKKKFGWTTSVSNIYRAARITQTDRWNEGLAFVAIRPSLGVRQEYRFKKSELERWYNNRPKRGRRWRKENERPGQRDRAFAGAGL